MSGLVVALAEEIKERGRQRRQSPAELPPLLQMAEQLAQDQGQDLLTRGLAHRAAGNALQLLNRFEPALAHYNEAIGLLEGANEETDVTLSSRHEFERAEKLFEKALLLTASTSWKNSAFAPPPS